MNTNTTKRGLLKLAAGVAAYGAGAGAMAATSLAVSALSPSQAHGATGTDPAETFAHAWLDQWTSRGGSFLRDYNGGWVSGWPEYYDTALDRENTARLVGTEYMRKLAAGTERDRAAYQDHIDRNRGWHDAAYMGQMRALLDVLNAFPQGKDAVKALVAANPALGLRAQQKG